MDMLMDYNPDWDDYTKDDDVGFLNFIDSFLLNIPESLFERIVNIRCSEDCTEYLGFVKEQDLNYFEKI
jgi:hypothetical protein